MQRLLLVVLLGALSLFAQSAQALSCPADMECIPPNYTQWCHNLGLHACGTAGEVNLCYENTSLGFLGGRSYEHQVAVNIRAAMCPGGAGYTSGNNMGPSGPEYFYGKPIEQADAKEQPWVARLFHPLYPNGLDTTYQLAASRIALCPANWNMAYSYVSGLTEYRCQRPRVPDCNTNCTTNAPVLPLAQEKRLLASDFNGGGGLEVVRYYNSQSRFGINVQSSSLFGPNWSTNWESRLESYGATSLRVLRPNGTQIQYTLSAGVWSAWKGEAATLSEVPGAPAGTAAWLFRDRDNRLEAFTSTGRLLYVEYLDGRHFDLAYNSADRLQSVTARDGRRLVFSWSTTYDGAGAYPHFTRVSQVAFPDGSAAIYSYDAVYGSLKTVADSLSTRVTYLYNEAANSSATAQDRYYLITGIEDPGVHRYSTYKYGSTGLVTESGLAGGANLSNFALGSNYVDITSSTGIERRVFSSIADAQRVTQVTRRTCAGCAPSMTRSYSYDGNGYVDVETDFNGNTTDHDYNARGLETVRIEAQGKDSRPTEAVSEERKVESDWLASFRVPTERRVYRCSAPNTTAQACSTAASIRWQIESVSRFTYNARGQVTARCEVNPGNATAMAYVCGSSTHAPTGVRQSATAYCESSDISAGTCPLLGLVKSTNGARTDVADTSSLTYRAADDSACAAAPTTCAYRKGDLWTVTNALGQISEYVSYDGAGRVKRMQDANGVLTDLTYHARGWLLTRTLRNNLNGVPSGFDATTTLTYDGVGQVTRITQPDGAYINYTYDDAHRLTEIADNLGNKLVYTLDAAGNRTLENTRDPVNVLTRTMGRVYDGLGRLQQQLNAQNAATSFTYDANGNQDTVTDALTRVTDSDVDPLNRLIQSTDALMGSTKYRYDARNNLVQVTDAKALSTTYNYDGLNNLSQLVSPDTGTTAYTYDNAGNRATQTDARGVASTYTYDVLNRLIAIGYPTASNNLTFNYDVNHAACPVSQQFGIGRLTGFTDPSGSTQLCYDKRGNVKRKIAVVNGITQTTTWGHNIADRISSLTYPSGTSIAYGRDTLGRINAITVTPAGGTLTNLISVVTYYPYGPVKQITWGNGATTLRSYDQNYWIDSINSSQATGLDLDFTLDVVGNITGISDVVGGTPPNNSYTYDALYRLTNAAMPTGEGEGYTYDAIGNRLSKIIDPGFGPAISTPYTYGATSHRLLDVEGATRSYDANGNTTNPYANLSGGTGFVYDERNRLRERRSGYPSALTHQYTYNARGERVFKYAKLATKTSRTFGYDESGRLLVENDNNGLANQEFIWLDDLPVGLLTASTLHYIQPDHLGSPRKVIQASTNTAIWDWPILNNPFGEAAPNQDPDGNGTPMVLNLRFPGQYFDVETGLHYNYFRDYEPGTGRYVESDPIGLRGGVSTFGYVLNQPLKFEDPKGESAVVLEAAVVTVGVCYLAYVAISHRPVTASSSDGRPPGYPPDLPHPSDPAPTYTCTVTQSCSPPREAPDPNAGCQLKYSMMVAGCKKSHSAAAAVVCHAAAFLFLIACETLKS